MSGIEVAGLVFGVLPVLVEAVKAYSSVAEGLHTFRHYSREVRSISRQFQVQNCIFLNHCRLLLRLVEDENDAEAMLENDADERWTSKTLNDKLNTVLKDNYEFCRGTIEETKDIVNEVKNMMGEFDVLKAQKQSDEGITSAIKRLRKAVKITFNKHKYERYLASLRDQNDDLSVLRAQISAFQLPANTTNNLVRHKALPERFQSINNASQKLHEALCSAWCCDDIAHRSHYAKLCLHANVHEEVRLDLAISCHKKTMDREDRLEPPIWLYVQSMSMAGSQRPLAASQILTDLQMCLPVELSALSSPKLKKKASSDLSPTTQCRKKKKRVHFNDPGSISEPLQISGPHVSQEFNLCQAKNICHYLQRHYRTSTGSIEQNCIGYIETPCQRYKHKFYYQNRNTAENSGLSLPEVSTVFSIFDVMRHDAEDALEQEDQLRLAYKTALAILQYHDTPWLTERWRLSNMSYFGNQHSLDEAALKTLHLSSQILSPTQSVTNAATMEGVQATETAVSDEIKYGINNLPLFFLGVALLEIAHWKPLENKMTARDQNDQVFTARRLALGRAPLGPEYQKIVQKCLQCNFGFGTKLASKSLQTAVYNDVVCELESMIQRLVV